MSTIGPRIRAVCSSNLLDDSMFNYALGILSPVLCAWDAGLLEGGHRLGMQACADGTGNSNSRACRCLAVVFRDSDHMQAVLQRVGVREADPEVMADVARHTFEFDARVALHKPVREEARPDRVVLMIGCCQAGDTEEAPKLCASAHKFPTVYWATGVAEMRRAGKAHWQARVAAQRRKLVLGLGQQAALMLPVLRGPVAQELTPEEVANLMNVCCLACGNDPAPFPCQCGLVRFCSVDCMLRARSACPEDGSGAHPREMCAQTTLLHMLLIAEQNSDLHTGPIPAPPTTRAVRMQHNGVFTDGLRSQLLWDVTKPPHKAARCVPCCVDADRAWACRLVGLPLSEALWAARVDIVEQSERISMPAFGDVAVTVQGPAVKADGPCCSVDSKSVTVHDLLSALHARVLAPPSAAAVRSLPLTYLRKFSRARGGLGLDVETAAHQDAQCRRLYPQVAALNQVYRRFGALRQRLHARGAPRGDRIFVLDLEPVPDAELAELSLVRVMETRRVGDDHTVLTN